MIRCDMLCVLHWKNLRTSCQFDLAHKQKELKVF